MANAYDPLHVGDFGTRIRLNITNQAGTAVTMDGTVTFLFTGAPTGGAQSKTATIESAGYAYWDVTAGFLIAPGVGTVQARVANVAGTWSTATATFRVDP